MTTPSRDDDLRDPRFDAAWRDASREEPPPALDAAIRAAARRAVDAGPQREISVVPEATRPERWWWPLAAAATIGAIAIGLLQLVPPGHEAANSTSAIVSDIPAGSAANGVSTLREKAATSTSKADATRSAQDATRLPAAASEAPAMPSDAARPPESPRTPTPRSERAAPIVSPAPQPFPTDADKRESGVPPSPAVVPPPQLGAPLSAGAAADVAPAPAKASPTARADAARGREPVVPDISVARESASIEVKRAPVAAGGMAVAPSPAAGAQREARAERKAAEMSGAPAVQSVDPAVAAKAQERAGLAVADWVALIRKLIADGRGTDAALELKAFRLAHPDADALLPPDLRDWPVAPR